MIRWLYEVLSPSWAELRNMQVQVRNLQMKHVELRSLIMTTANDLAARLDAATNELASDLQGVRDELAAVRDGASEQVQAAVDSALAVLEPGIARLEALGQDPADPVPAPADEEPAAPAEGEQA